MKRRLIRTMVIICAVSLGFLILRGYSTKNGKVQLPSSKLLLTPAPGNPQPTNSFPAAMALSPDGKYLALLNDGYGTFEADYHQSISILDIAKNSLRDFPDERLARKAHQTYFYGLAFSRSGKKLYASMSSMTDHTGRDKGNSGSGVAIYDCGDGTLKQSDFIRIPTSNRPAQPKIYRDPEEEATPESSTAIPFPSGIAAFERQGKEMLLVADNLSDQAEIVDVAAKRVDHRIDLGIYHAVPGSYPFAAVVTNDGITGYISLWNGSRVAEVDLSSAKLRRMILLRVPSKANAAGSHPTAMLLSPDQKRLYVTLANRDEVAVVDRGDGNAFYLSTKLPGQQYGGNFPIGLAISPDGRWLFVANASSDAVAVFKDPKANSKPLGFIPTEWYATALAIQDGELFIATGKGQGTGPNKGLTGKVNGKDRTNYIASLLHGSLARIRTSDIESHLRGWTEQVMDSNLMRGNADQIAFSAGGNPIKHVIYIIKENRSYDQVLGDLGVGDGDPSLVMFGEEITPNEHKLARQFGVLDNFYDSGEVSGDGHVWSTAAITSDYNEKTWQIAYRGKERTYDFQGQNADEFPLDRKIPDIDDPSTGFIWDNLAAHHVSFRIYGEFVNALWCNEKRKAWSPKQGTPSGQESPCPRTEVAQGGKLPPNVGNPHGGVSPWPWPVPLFSGVKPTKAVLRGHFDPLYPDFNTDYPDQLRADEFLNEFAAYVRAREQREGPDLELPSFVLLYLPDDHTGGTRPGRARPAANVSDNDLALGRVVDAVSHSPYWD